MSATILVPLDGSAFAEQAIPYAQRLASAIRGHLGIGITQDDPGDELGAPRGEMVGNESTMQSSDERRPFDTEPID